MPPPHAKPPRDYNVRYSVELLAEIVRRGKENT